MQKLTSIIHNVYDNEAMNTEPSVTYLNGHYQPLPFDNILENPPPYPLLPVEIHVPTDNNGNQNYTNHDSSLVRAYDLHIFHTDNNLSTMHQQIVQLNHQPYHNQALPNNPTLFFLTTNVQDIRLFRGIVKYNYNFTDFDNLMQYFRNYAINHCNLQRPQFIDENQVVCSPLFASYTSLLQFLMPNAGILLIPAYYVMFYTFVNTLSPHQGIHLADASYIINQVRNFFKKYVYDMTTDPQGLRLQNADRLNLIEDLRHPIAFDILNSIRNDIINIYQPLLIHMNQRSAIPNNATQGVQTLLTHLNFVLGNLNYPQIHQNDPQSLYSFVETAFRYINDRKIQGPQPRPNNWAILNDGSDLLKFFKVWTDYIHLDTRFIAQNLILFKNQVNLILSFQYTSANGPFHFRNFDQNSQPTQNTGPNTYTMPVPDNVRANQNQNNIENNPSQNLINRANAAIGLLRHNLGSGNNRLIVFQHLFIIDALRLYYNLQTNVDIISNNTNTAEHHAYWYDWRLIA